VERPKKRRKTKKKIEQDNPPPDRWPSLLGGQEPETNIRLRQHGFESAWAQQQAIIDALVHRVDEGFVDDVLEYVRATTNQGEQERIKTGLIVSTATNALGDFVQGWKSRPAAQEILIHLRPSHAPNLQVALKNVIKLALTREGPEEYTSFLASHKALIPMNFDLELLQRYTDRHKIGRVLLCLSDVETFDTSVLAELIGTAHSWADRVPFVLLVGVSTTVELFESRLSRSVVQLLDAQVFASSSPPLDKTSDARISCPLYELYAAVQTHADSRLFWGPAVVDVLAELAQDQSTTVAGFARAMKYVYMSHFFANPLSVLVQPEGSDFDASLCRAIRHTPGFQSRCESLASQQRQHARDLLTSDEVLGKEAREAVRSGQRRLRSSLAACHTLQRMYRHLDARPPVPPLECQAQMLAALPDLKRSGVFEAVENALTDVTSVAELRDFLEAASDLLEGEDEEDGSKDVPTVADIITTLPTDGDHVDLTGPDSPVETFLTRLGQYLDSKTMDVAASATSSTATNPFRDFLSEAYTYNHKSPLSAILHPRGRHSLERALTRPADYLGCRCCGADANSSAGLDDGEHRSSLPPTSLLLTMLNEAGSVVNVRDLWDTFRGTIGPGINVNGSSHKTVDEGSDDDGEEEEVDDRSALALFYRSLGELRQLGLVRPSKRKPGVDCIAKTAWMGL
jgi:origin recognition complex subunit 3